MTHDPFRPLTFFGVYSTCTVPYMIMSAERTTVEWPSRPYAWRIYGKPHVVDPGITRLPQTPRAGVKHDLVGWFTVAIMYF